MTIQVNSVCEELYKLALNRLAQVSADNVHSMIRFLVALDQLRIGISLCLWKQKETIDEKNIESFFNVLHQSEKTILTDEKLRDFVDRFFIIASYIHKINADYLANEPVKIKDNSEKISFEKEKSEEALRKIEIESTNTLAYTLPNFLPPTQYDQEARDITPTDDNKEKIKNFITTCVKHTIPGVHGTPIRSEDKTYIELLESIIAKLEKKYTSLTKKKTAQNKINNVENKKCEVLGVKLMITAYQNTSILTTQLLYSLVEEASRNRDIRRHRNPVWALIQKVSFFKNCVPPTDTEKDLHNILSHESLRSTVA